MLPAPTRIATDEAAVEAMSFAEDAAASEWGGAEWAVVSGESERARGLKR
jgi:hypothetical protein